MKREKRHKRIRAKIKGTKKRPRLCVFRSNQHIYCQLIDDEQNRVLAEASDLSFKKMSNIEKAKKVGQEIAKKAEEKKITTVVFDRAGYKYHGRVKALADKAREKGLNF